MTGAVGFGGTSDTVRTPGNEEPFLKSVSEPRDITSNSSEEEFRGEWGGLISQINSVRYNETDITERLSGAPFERGIEIANEFPEFLEVEHGPFGRRTSNLEEHLLDHFDYLFNSDKIKEDFRPPAPGENFETLLRFAEVIYINDATYRFVGSTFFEPSLPDLDSVNFMHFPEGLAEWMEEGELVYFAINNENALEMNGNIREEIDRLYTRRESFIEDAYELGVFHPIMPDDTTGHLMNSSNIRSRLSRTDSGVNTNKVHRHCYSKLKETIWTELI